MKTASRTNHLLGVARRPLVLAAAVTVTATAIVWPWTGSQAQDKEVQATAASAATSPRGEETEMDLPADFHKYYGQRVNQWRDTDRRIAKLDIDGDLNYDGTIDNFDPADNGAFEATPPGLVVGTGEMTKIIVRVNPYRVDFQGEVVIALEVSGVNRAVRSGQFESFEQEIASTGRIRVWKDATKSELLLDSADPNQRYREWVADERAYPANLPGIYPRTFYVEGVSASGNYSGDLRVLMTVSHRERGAPRESYPESRKKFVKSFRTTFDHILFTVAPQPQAKDFINNNAEGVWLSASAAGSK